MNQNYCLNCKFNIDNKFCPSCGQKTDTHQIVMKHFVMHDLLHGVWHLEKGILFTLKETIIRPGQAALDYIGGKRIRYYNVFYLSLLVIGLNILLLHLNEAHPEEGVEIVKNNQMAFNDFISKYSKIILFCIVPILALNAKLIFQRLNLNIAEHFILGGITLLGLLILSSALFIFGFLNVTLDSSIFGIAKIITFFIILLFPTWSYFNATQKIYNFWGFLWRICFFYLLTLLEFFAIIAFITVVILKNTSAPIQINI